MAGAGSDSEGEDDRIDQELAPIRTQLALALQLQGRTDEARALYQQVVKLKCVLTDEQCLNSTEHSRPVPTKELTHSGCVAYMG